MKPLISFFFTICSLFLLKAQNSSFVYQLDYKPNADSLKTEKIIFYLDRKDNKSIFRSVSFRKNDSLRVKRGYPDGFDMNYNNKQLYICKNFAENTTKKYVFVPLVNYTFAININETLDWKITNEKIKIGNFNCQKATTDYSGRKWTAWFTNEIPIQDGPYIFKGLPGLIIKISDDKQDYNFELGQVRDFKWKELYPDKIKKVITWEDFDKLQLDFYKNPWSSIKSSDITKYDEGGNEIKFDFQKELEHMQKRIQNRNNPIELNHKIIYK
jgi:GLPGLI family protein